MSARRSPTLPRGGSLRRHGIIRNPYPAMAWYFPAREALPSGRSRPPPPARLFRGAESGAGARPPLPLFVCERGRERARAGPRHSAKEGAEQREAGERRGRAAVLSAPRGREEGGVRRAGRWRQGGGVGVGGRDREERRAAVAADNDGVVCAAVGQLGTLRGRRRQDPRPQVGWLGKFGARYRGGSAARPAGPAAQSATTGKPQLGAETCGFPRCWRRGEPGPLRPAPPRCVRAVRPGPGLPRAAGRAGAALPRLRPSRPGLVQPGTALSGGAAAGGCWGGAACCRIPRQSRQIGAREAAGSARPGRHNGLYPAERSWAAIPSPSFGFVSHAGGAPS